MKPILFAIPRIGKLENLVDMVFLVEVNNRYSRYGTHLNELCMKNTNSHVGTAEPEFLLRSKARNIFEFLFAFSSLMQTRFPYFGKLSIFPLVAINELLGRLPLGINSKAKLCHGNELPERL